MIYRNALRPMLALAAGLLASPIAGAQTRPSYETPNPSYEATCGAGYELAGGVAAQPYAVVRPAVLGIDLGCVGEHEPRHRRAQRRDPLLVAESHDRRSLRYLRQAVGVVIGIRDGGLASDRHGRASIGRIGSLAA